ncbi:MAG TPA: hypothetical protein VJV03_12355 [Pyrinomonadaceae bacterium]|nr:hypothetical protein [Pyrinomonadaceae bacterium]
MKRCPQCEFIYEDEQTMCDMDGAMLAFDKSGVAADGRSAKSFAVPAIVGTALAVVIFLAFYTSPLLIAKPDARELSPVQAPSTNPESAPAMIPIATPVPSPDAASKQARIDQMTKGERTADSNHVEAKSDRRLTISRGLPPLPRVPSLPRLPPARIRKSSTESTGTQPRKRSKVETFLKKTGRVIRKPFKF